MAGWIEFLFFAFPYVLGSLIRACVEARAQPVWWRAVKVLIGLNVASAFMSPVTALVLSQSEFWPLACVFGLALEQGLVADDLIRVLWRVVSHRGVGPPTGS